MTETLYGLTEEQHSQVGRLVKDAAYTSREPTGQARRDPSRYRGIARVILLGNTDPRYTPRSTRDCALFEYLPTGQQTTLEFTGQGLEGDIVLTIDGIEIQIDCQSTTSELQAAINAAGISIVNCRATVFPGLWEFDFNRGIYNAAAPAVTAEPYEVPPGDSETPEYIGGLLLRQEGWRSVSSDGRSPDKITTVDWMPFDDGAIKSGAIGGAMWHYGAGWLVTAWQCRDWSFASPPAESE